MHLDWSTDDKVIQSDSSDYEHLFCTNKNRIFPLIVKGMSKRVLKL
jgi:hypothetical protein